MHQAQKLSDSYYSQTYDTSFIATYEHTNVLPNTLASKLFCAWGRIFMAKLKQNSEQYKYKNNLSIVLAQRMPPHISTQVVKMVKYYEEHMEDQINIIHKLVEQNKRLKHKIEEQQDKENIPQVVIHSKDDNRQRVSQLEQCVMEKNKQIAGLNKQITDLLGKVKKYKKRVYELQARSPVKSAISELF